MVARTVENPIIEDFTLLEHVVVSETSVVQTEDEKVQRVQFQTEHEAIDIGMRIFEEQMVGGEYHWDNAKAEEKPIVFRRQILVEKNSLAAQVLFYLESTFPNATVGELWEVIFPGIHMFRKTHTLVNEGLSGVVSFDEKTTLRNKTFKNIAAERLSQKIEEYLKTLDSEMPNNFGAAKREIILLLEATAKQLRREATNSLELIEEVEKIEEEVLTAKKQLKAIEEGEAKIRDNIIQSLQNKGLNTLIKRIQHFKSEYVENKRDTNTVPPSGTIHLYSHYLRPTV